MAVSCQGMLATRRCRRSTGTCILDHWSNSRLAKFKKVGVIHVDDCTPQFVPQMLDRVAVRESCRLVLLNDVLLLQIISHYPGPMRRSIDILVAEIISKVLPNKWYQGVPQDILILQAIDVPIQEHKGWSGNLMDWHPDMDWTPSSLNPSSLAVLLEAFSGKSTNSHVAIPREQLKTWLISPDDVWPSSHSQVLPTPCPV